MIRRVILLLLLSTNLAFGGSFKSKCSEMESCIAAVSELTGQKYVYDSSIKGKIEATDNVELTAENAEALFTHALHVLGYSRVPLPAANTFGIQRQRDARDAAIPTFECDFDHAPKLPENWDIVTMKYKLKTSGIADDIARSMRSFMPANSRIIPSELSGMVIITDSAMNLKKIYSLIRDNDHKPSPEYLKKRTEEREYQRKHPPQLPPPGPPPAHPQSKDGA